MTLLMAVPPPVCCVFCLVELTDPEDIRRGAHGYCAATEDEFNELNAAEDDEPADA